MNFAQSVKMTTQTTRTENGAFAYNTTSNAILDLFAQIGALRPRSEQEIRTKFASAFALDPKLATKMLFYAGNVRGGLGERRTFRICLKWLAENHPSIAVKNLANIAHFNRWDSIFVLVDTKAETYMWDFVAETLNNDIQSFALARKSGHATSISLLAKWMPTETASSPATRKLAHKAMRGLGLTPRQYRKTLSTLREYLHVVERSMSKREWGQISYAAVPSYAMKNYRKAFDKHDPIRFGNYKTSLVKGETKINASTLYPYDLVAKYIGSRYYATHTTPDTIIEEQWKALPNYVTGENNFIVMADVSGSMAGRPMQTSVGLATYFAQHNKGAYHNLYMTFSSDPSFLEIREGATLAEICGQVMGRGVGYSTNLNKAFDCVLTHAVRNRIRPADMPKAIVVVSDMEIDSYMRPGYNWDFVKTQKAKFAAYGYQLPKLVMWNVEARKDTFLTQSEDVIFVSGQSVSSFKNLCQSLSGKTAWDFMLEVLNDKMYDCVAI